MARRNYSQPSGTQAYQRRYSGFRGVDFTNNPMAVDFSRSPYAENIITDSAGVVHKRPGYSIYQPDKSSVHSMLWFKPPIKYTDKSLLFVHAAGSVDAEEIEGMEPASQATFNNADSVMFQHGERVYLLDGRDYWVYYYDDEHDSSDPEWKWRSVREIATAPETQIAGYWLAEEYTEINESTNEGETKFKYTWQFGEKGERNLLTGRRINTFCGDGIHQTYYLDCQHFKVYKVEVYRYIPDQVTTSSSATTTSVAIKANSNIRKGPSTSTEVVEYIKTQKTAVTTGKTGNWYQIVWNGNTAYVHKNRLASEPSQSAVTTYSSDKDGWETVPSSHYTISEDDSKHCTKIVFDSDHKPPAHPRGNGLPNIRVTGAMTEITTETATVGASDIVNDSYTYYINSDKLLTGLISVSKNGSEVSSSGYSLSDRGDHGLWIQFDSGTVSEGDTITVTYRRESFRDNDIIEKCNKYGKFGEYNTDRFFFTGNPDHLNRDWYSEPGDPTLVLENSYTDIGDQTTGIAGYLNYQADMLIIKYDSNSDNLFRRTADTDGDLTIFPVKSYKGRGATSAHAIANIKGECVYLSPEGVMEFVSSDLGTRYSTKLMSYLIQTKLAQEAFELAEMGVWGDWLVLSFPNTEHCYIADTSQATAPSPSGGNGWEWFYWTGMPASSMIYNVEDERLYFAGNGHVNYISKACDAYRDEVAVTFGEDDAWAPSYFTDIVATWSTPQDALEDPARFKFINARGTIMHFVPGYQQLHYAVVLDGNTVLTRRYEEIEQDEDVSQDFDFIEIQASEENPVVLLNRRIHRFKTLQFIFRHDDPETDGIGLLALEFQYRFGRYIH